ncbi:hypothetical protein MP638_002481 [Amoeboaphelidium occidentale]|nr:hypothetical protein MP638_002481 [Amoeboaphelidium occidentale]
MTITTKLPPSAVICFCKKCNAALYFTYDDMMAEFKDATPVSMTIKCHQCSVELTVASVYSGMLPSADKFGRILIPPNAPYVKLSQALSDQPQGSSAVGSKYSQMDYYEILHVQKTSTSDEIKKAYYKLAMKHHPDKFRGTEQEVQENEEHFKAISEAYQILSDQTLRERYDRYGRETNDDSALRPDGGFKDPEKFFKDVFGGEMFVDLIGELSISRELGDAMNGLSGEAGGAGNANSSQEHALSDEEKDKRRRERIVKLANNLLHKMSAFTDSTGNNDVVAQEFMRKIKEEAEDLKHASYGVELLHAIGYMYCLKANQWLGKEDTFLGIGKVWGDFRERGHFISETFGTIKSAVELQSTISKLQQHEEASQKGSVADAKEKRKILTEEEKARLEELAAKKGLDTIWKGSKIEIETVIRDVCDVVLSGKPVEFYETKAKENTNETQNQAQNNNVVLVDKKIIRKRAQALQLIGKCYQEVKPDADYVSRKFQ